MGQPENNAPPGPLTHPPGVWWRTRWFRWGIRLVYLLVIAGLAGLLLKYPPPQVGVMRIVDEQGKPVAGAVVTMDGLRVKSKLGHWGWNESVHGSKGPYKSDQEGLVTFDYPAFVLEELETSEVSFGVKHEIYSPDRILSYVVNDSPPRSAGLMTRLGYLKDSLVHRFQGKKPSKDIVLKKGAILELRALLDGEPVATQDVLPILNNWNYSRTDWLDTKDGILRCAQMSPGEVQLYLAYLPAGGKPCFSEPISFTAKAGKTNRYDLRLIPGVKVSGRLSPEVKGPVVRGRVNAYCRTNDLHWWTWTEIDAEGRFTFDSLPRGNLELAGICEGYVSKKGVHPNWTTSAWLTQLSQISGMEEQVKLVMEEAAACRVLVLTPEGKPLAGAKVSIYPGIQFSMGGTLFPGQFWRAEDSLKASRGIWKAQERAQQWFTASTDKDGHTLIRNVPGETQSLVVQSDGLEMPLDPTPGAKRRLLEVKLRPGQTNEVKVVMQKKGTDVLKD